MFSNASDLLGKNSCISVLRMKGNVALVFLSLPAAPWLRGPHTSPGDLDQNLVTVKFASAWSEVFSIDKGHLH